MKIWVDDLRPPPSDVWVWTKSSNETTSLLKSLCREGSAWMPLEIISLDHDLGGDDTTRPIVLWMCENDIWFKEVRVHTANPVGREWLEGMIERYKTS